MLMLCELNNFKVVVWGDSIAGMPPEPWPEKMKNSFNACLVASCRLEVVNSGICGIAAADAKNNFQRDVAVHQPDLVIIQFGFNDMRYCGRRKNLPISTVEEFQKHIFEMIEMCKRIGAEVLVLTNHRVVSFLVLPSQLTRGESVEHYNQASIAAARQANVEYIDIQQIDISPLTGKELVVADGVHLSDWGKMVYSHNVANRVLQIIRRRGL